MSPSRRCTTRPALSSFFHWSAISVKLAKPPQSSVITQAWTRVRNEVTLLIYHAIDMKITISGNKVVITCLCFRNMSREKTECGSCAAAHSGMFEKASGGGCPLIPHHLSGKTGEHLWKWGLSNNSLCQLKLTCCSPLLPQGHLYSSLTWLHFVSFLCVELKWL